MSETIVVRRAEERDLPRLGELAAGLVRLHHAADPARFFAGEGVESGYARWLGAELKRDGAMVLVAERDGRVAGYGYATLEGRDWMSFLDVHGAIHDLMIAEDARGTGVGDALLRALCAELDALGAPRVVLTTMVGNTAAQRLFASVGFRPTMLEMMRERPGS